MKTIVSIGNATLAGAIKNFLPKRRQRRLLVKFTQAAPLQKGEDWGVRGRKLLRQLWFRHRRDHRYISAYARLSKKDLVCLEKLNDPAVLNFLLILMNAYEGLMDSSIRYFKAFKKDILNQN